MFSDTEGHNFKTLDAARRKAVSSYKIGDYWTVDTIYYGPSGKPGKHAGTVYLPGWIGLTTMNFEGIWIPTKKGGVGLDLTKARFVNKDGSLGKSATAFWKKFRRN